MTPIGTLNIFGTTAEYYRIQTSRTGIKFYVFGESVVKNKIVKYGNAPFLKYLGSSKYTKSENDLWNQEKPPCLHRKATIEAWNKLVADFKIKTNSKLRIPAGFSCMTPQAARDRAAGNSNRIEKTVHATGRAIDLTMLAGQTTEKYAYPDPNDPFLKGNQQFDFLNFLWYNAHKFGFEGVTNEWWHWEYRTPLKTGKEPLIEDDVISKDANAGTPTQPSNTQQQIQEQKISEEQLLARLSEISSGILTNEGAAEKQEKPKEATVQSKTTTQYEAKQVTESTMPKDKIIIKVPTSEKEDKGKG